MNSILQKIGITKPVDFSSIMVVYESEDCLWRGFVVPFDLSYEADTKEEVQRVLKDMLTSYLDALKKYNNPVHLSELPLSDENDGKKWSTISMDVFNKLRNNISKIENADYYAEAQLPA